MKKNLFISLLSLITYIGISQSVPTASFTINNGIICVNSAISFSNHSTSNSTSWQWAFTSGNPASSTSQNPTTTYTAIGSYVVSLIAKNGTVTSTPYTLTISVLPTPTVAVSTGTICANSPIQLTANGAVSYSWSTGDASSTITVTPSSSAQYTVIGTGANGCKAFAVSDVTVMPLPIVFVPSSAICNGESKSLNVSGALSYTWSTGSNAPFILVTPTITTSYSCTGTDAIGCKKTSVSVITVNDVPTMSVNSTSLCSGAPVTISVTGTANTYTWSSGETTTSLTVIPLVTTSYTCTGSTILGCKTQVVSTITVSPNPTITITTGSICAGNNQTISATGATNYVWSDGSALTSISVTPSVTTTYTCVGSFANGCNSYNTATVIVRPLPNLALTSTSICSGFSGVLQAIGASTYSWSNGVTSSTISVTPNSYTTYTCTGISNFGCIKTLTTSVNVFPTPIIALTSGTICYGMTATVSAAPALSYTWSNGNHGSSFLVVPNATTTYTCIGNSGDNCPFVSTTTLVVISVTTPTITQHDMTLTSSASSGNQWYFNNVAIPGATGQVYTATQNGNYSVIVTNNGCSSNPANKTILDTGLENFNLKDLITLFPNPVNNFLSISIPNTFNEELKFVIYNSNGQLIKENNLGNETTKIDLSNLTQGLYLIEFSTGNHQAIFKFIKD